MYNRIADLKKEEESILEFHGHHISGVLMMQLNKVSHKLKAKDHIYKCVATTTSPTKIIAIPITIDLS